MLRAVLNTRILVFTKSPRPGTVKTRLIPLLGKRGAADLQKLLLEHTLETACAASFSSVELHCAPGTRSSFLRTCGARYGVSLFPQSTGDLGVRIKTAMQNALIESPRAILIGTDCPALTVHHFREAATQLAAGKDAVFVPTEDGGYALVGLARFDACVFDGIDWGTSSVMNETRARMTNLGWNWHELETLWDVDRPQDYQRLLASAFLKSPQWLA
jgi:rSAM/selenodomain-associated transferase 1